MQFSKVPPLPYTLLVTTNLPSIPPENHVIPPKSPLQRYKNDCSLIYKQGIFTEIDKRLAEAHFINLQLSILAARYAYLANLKEES